MNEIEVRDKSGSKVSSLTQEAINIYDELSYTGINTGDMLFIILDPNAVALQAAFYSEGFISWLMGQEYLVTRTGMLSGSFNIYEMVGRMKDGRIIAFLNSRNSDIENTSVIAHVYGHATIMRNNIIEKMSNVSLNEVLDTQEKLNSLKKKIGESELEKIIENAKSLSSLQNRYPDIYKRTEPDTISSDLPPSDEYDVADFVIRNAMLPEQLKDIYNRVLSFFRYLNSGRIKILHESYSTFVQSKLSEYYTKKGEIGKSLEVLDLIEKVANPIYIFSAGNLYSSQFPYSMYMLIDYIFNLEINSDNALLKSIIETYDDTSLLRDYFSVDFLEYFAKKMLNRYSTLDSRIRDDELIGGIVDFVAKVFGENSADIANTILRLPNMKDKDTEEVRKAIDIYVLQTNIFPILYIPKGGYTRYSLSLRQLLPLEKYIQTKYYSEEETRTWKALFTVDNSKTLGALDVVANLLKVPYIQLQTYDEKGKLEEVQIKYGKDKNITRIAKE